MFGKKMIYFSHIPNLLGWLFCIAAEKRYYLLQIQLQRNLFMTNGSIKTFSFVKRVFINPSILRSIFSDIFCANAFVIYNVYIVATLEPPLMHNFQPQIESMSTESGNG